jgi:hypothetical protein
MAYGTVNADVIGTSVAGSNLGAGNASIMKNRIINGGMVIDQRNAGASVSAVDGNYSVDRWKIRASISGKFTLQQNAGSVTPPVGYSNYLGITSTANTSLASGDFNAIQQGIEGYNFNDLGFGTANAKTVTISFQVYSSLTGTFGGALYNGIANRSYPFTFSIPVANTWTSISITIPGDTSGTWSATNTASAFLTFGLGIGSTYSGTAGSWSSNIYLSATGATSVVGTNGATFYITGVQLEVGSSATGFEYRQYGQELALCQRYAQIFTNPNTQNVRFAVAGNYSSGSNLGYPSRFLSTTMRTSPSLTISAVGDFKTQQFDSLTQTVTALSVDNASTDEIGFSVTVGSNFSNGMNLLANNGNAKMILSAEL